MRVKTSVTIDEKVLRAIDRAATPGRSRSRIIEDAARDYLTRQARTARDTRDRELIDQAADALNRDDGLKHESSVHCDALASVPKTLLTDFVGSLGSQRKRRLDRALGIAPGLA